MKYKIVVGRTYIQLSQEVENHLNQGWILYGNPYLGGISDYNHHHCQAMILNSKE
jgi:hypothetical protein